MELSSELKSSLSLELGCSALDATECLESGTDQSTNGSETQKKKKGRVRNRKNKVKKYQQENQKSSSHGPSTQPSPSQRSQATQTDRDLGELATTRPTAGTQTQIPTVRDKSTQTPGTRFARESQSDPKAQETPATKVSPPPESTFTKEAPCDQLPKDQSHLNQPTARAEQGPAGSAKPRQTFTRNPNHLLVLTWNIDGLDSEDMGERFSSLLSYFSRIKADIVLLQELIPPIAEGLEDIMKNYEFIFGNTSGYFTGMLFLKSRVKLLQSDVVNYPTTEQGRNLLMAQVSFSGHRLWVLTSHLESMRDSSQERLNQLRRVWKRMREAPLDQAVLYGGDTNLRDKEVKRLGGLPGDIIDVWEAVGSPEACQYTWDTVENNNKDLPFPARLRFDRLYLRSGGEGPKIIPLDMKLVGKKQLDCGRFTSDHWGILCTFSLEP